MLSQIRQAAHDQSASYLTMLQRLVELESPTHDKLSVNLLANHLESLLKSRGWQVDRDLQSEVGDHLIAHISGPGNDSTLILAHYDTVWPAGTLNDMPFLLRGGKVYGPGILDMKGGIAAAISAVEIVRQLGHIPRGPLTLLITSDEETGSLHSRHLIERVALEHERVLVVEPGHPDGGLKNSRKAIGHFRVGFHGISAHAGNNPQDGASALRELAHFLFFAEALTDVEKGISVNVTVATAGSVSNVIAETAVAEVDLRAQTISESERIVNEIAGYRPRDERVQVDIQGGMNRPALEFTDVNRALFDEAVRLGAAMGIPLTGRLAGGGSDGNFTSALGIPTLDGLGAVGFGPHMREEHIDLPATLDRIALLASLICES